MACTAFDRHPANRSTNSSRVQMTISAAAEGVGGAQIGDEIGDRDIGLVAHRRHHRHRTGGDGARDRLFVERPQVFERAAAAAYNHQVGPTGAAEPLDGAADFFDRPLALHLRRKEADVQPWKSASEDLYHVGDGGAARRRDDADLARKAGQWALALLGEEALRRELLLKLLEGHLERAEPLRLQQFHEQLIFAASLIDIDAAARQYGEPIVRAEFPITMRGAEGHAFHGGFPLFQGEVIMAARRQLQAGDLARDPDLAELLVEHGTDRGVEFADGKDAALREKIEVECELLQAIMVARRPIGHLAVRGEGGRA